jgi:protein SCO1/2
MGEAVDKIQGFGGENSVLPLFISVDPARDSVAQVKKYIQGECLQTYTGLPNLTQLIIDFHPKMVGLTGDWAAVKAICKTYRVYFSTPPDAKPTDDYLVDHS